MMDAVVARKLKAEWFRHGLHGAYLRGEHAIRADELRQLVGSYQRVLFDVLSEAEDFDFQEGESE